MCLKKWLHTVAAIFLCTLALPLSFAKADQAPAPITSPPDTTPVEVVSEPVPEPEPFDFSQIITVGYYSAFTDFIDDLGNLQYKGYGYDVFQKISEVSGLVFEFVPIHGSMVDAVNSGLIDMAGFSIRTDERQEELLYSSIQYSKTYVTLMSHDMSLPYANPETLDGKTVATYEGNIAHTALERFCNYHGVSMEYVYGDVFNYMHLDTDFYITYAEDRTAHIGHNVLNLGVHNLYMTTSFENQELMDLIDTIFLDVVATEGNFFLELEDAYLANNLEINHRGLTGEEIQQLQSRPLQVGYVDHFRPLSFTNEDGEADGAMVETLNLFAESYGFEVVYTPYKLTDDPASYDHYDLLLTLYGDRAQVAAHYQPTEIYYSIPVYAQIHADIHKNSKDYTEMIINSPRIGTLPYMSLDYDSFLAVFTGNKFVFYNDWHELLDAFAAGDVDMIMSTESGSSYAELYLEDTDKLPFFTTLTIPMQFQVSNTIAQTYMPIFNVMLDKVSQEEYAGIINTNASVYYPDQSVNFFEFLVEKWYVFAALFLLVVVGYFGIAYHGQLKKRQALEVAHNTDSLTGFLAIHKFDDLVAEQLKTAKPNEYELISFDVDMFKTINTHFSAERGTSVIQAIASGLRQAFSELPVLVCRRTADQFLIFRKVDEGGPIRLIYNGDILPSVEHVLPQKFRLTMSFGQVIIENCKESVTTIIGQADNARVHGKHDHVTTFITFDEEMCKYYEGKVNVTFRMEQALTDREFLVVYQPKVDLNTLEIGGMEALVRWHPKLGDPIYPDEFIPILEENGFIASLDMYMLDEVCRFIKENRRTLHIPRISVNLSAHTVLAQQIIPKISEILNKYEVAPQDLEFELTESAVEADTGKFLTRVKQLKKMGFYISIDDFGAGVSSLNRLSKVEADVMKLDKAFFSEGEHMGKGMIVVADVIRMAKRLSMKVVAEGVETRAQAQWLKNINCDYAQGYYFAKPMGKDAIIDLLLSNKIYALKSS